MGVPMLTVGRFQAEDEEWMQRKDGVNWVAKVEQEPSVVKSSSWKLRIGGENIRSYGHHHQRGDQS
jgi:hypothetical protein